MESHGGECDVAFWGDAVRGAGFGELVSPGGPSLSDSTTRPTRLHAHIHSPKRLALAHPRSPMPPIGTICTRNARATHAQRTRTHFTPRHRLRCHLGLYWLEFEFPALCLWQMAARRRRNLKPPQSHVDLPATK